MGSRGGRDYPPDMPLWLVGGFFLYQTHFSLWAIGRQKPGALNRRSVRLPTLSAALVYMASSLFPSRWTHEDWLEAVADTTENCVGGKGSSAAGKSGLRDSWGSGNPQSFLATLPRPGLPLPFVPLAVCDLLWPDPCLLGQQLSQVSLHRLDPLSPPPMLLPLASCCLSLPSPLRPPGPQGALLGDR